MYTMIPSVDQSQMSQRYARISGGSWMCFAAVKCTQANLQTET